MARPSFLFGCLTTLFFIRVQLLTALGFLISSPIGNPSSILSFESPHKRAFSRRYSYNTVTFAQRDAQDVYTEFGVNDVINAKPFSLPRLSWHPTELAPLMSKQTIKLHYGKHHAGYVRKLNGFMQDYPHLIGKTLEDIIKTEDGALFNNAAQIWNHNFFWSCLKPNYDNPPRGLMYELIKKDFGSFEHFQLLFSEAATGHFGSGWVWLIQKSNGTLAIESTHDASNPIKTASGIPLLVIDVWEHAYYVDYYNDRAAYIKAWFNIIDWDFVCKQLR